LELVDYLLLNEVEAGQILERDLGADINGTDIAKELRERFPKTAIVLTLGGDGSVYADAGQLFAQPVYPVRAVDTTAAGDTFSGYFLAGILSGRREKEAMDLAAKAAAIAVTRRGAAPSIPTMAEVE